MTYAKHTISSIRFESPVWGSVLYTNALAIGPMGALAVASGELSRTAEVRLDARTAQVLLARVGKSAGSHIRARNLWPPSAESVPNVVGVGPDSLDIGPNLADCPNSVDSGPTFAKIGPQPVWLKGVGWLPREPPQRFRLASPALATSVPPRTMSPASVDSSSGHPGRV